MIFDEKFIKSLPGSPYSAIIRICDRYREEIAGYELASVDGRELIIETITFLKSFIKIIGLPNDISSLPLRVGEREEEIVEANDAIMRVRDNATRLNTESQMDLYENLFVTKYGSLFHYEFAEGDLGRIQTLINELRVLIVNSKELEEDHIQRLCEKLEKLQSELHKKVTDVDRFWGFLLEASIVLGQLGDNVKPMVDVIQKIVGIIWPAQTRAFGFSSDLPLKLLGESKDDKDDKSKKGKTRDKKS
jgi:hypothetical protein